MELKVAIVGAAGTLGKQLAAHFQESGRSVRALVRTPEKMEGILTGRSEAVPCDLLKIPGSLLTEYLKGCDVVIHAATQLPLRAREIRDWEPTNRLRMEGTSRLIEAALRAGVGYYIQQSTVSAYIHGGEQWLDENTPFDISPSRAVMTLAVADMERRVREIPIQKMQWAILRIGQLVGPGTTEAGLARDLEEGRAVVSGNGRHFFSPVHIVDAASAFVQAARRRIGQRVLNITDEPIRFGDYLDHLADRLRVARPSRDLTQVKTLSQRCSNEAARKVLDWVPYWGLHLDEKIRIGA